MMMMTRNCKYPVSEFNLNLTTRVLSVFTYLLSTLFFSAAEYPGIGFSSEYPTCLGEISVNPTAQGVSTPGNNGNCRHSVRLRHRMQFAAVFTLVRTV